MDRQYSKNHFSIFIEAQNVQIHQNLEAKIFPDHNNFSPVYEKVKKKKIRTHSLSISIPLSMLTLTFYSEDGGIMFLQNTDNDLPGYMVPHLRRS
jgi:hypothetical protein